MYKYKMLIALFAVFFIIVGCRPQEGRDGSDRSGSENSQSENSQSGSESASQGETSGGTSDPGESSQDTSEFSGVPYQPIEHGRPNAQPSIKGVTIVPEVIHVQAGKTAPFDIIPQLDGVEDPLLTIDDSSSRNIYITPKYEPHEDFDNQVIVGGIVRARSQIYSDEPVTEEFFVKDRYGTIVGRATVIVSP
ncbi:MAG: hypothetical protein FWH14_02700 [Oscillospiraceae bacterium]|nr:hypothetical protein [Oscillospiraceae bacterium]